MKDDKYIVFKLGDAQHTEFGAHYNAEEALNDAVVIRTQDVFAAGGLYAYAHVIDAFLHHPMSEDEASGLEEVRDYFLSVAQEAEDRLHRGECKVPD